jgi:hypothetical protein
MNQKKPIHKTFTYTLHMKNGSSCAMQYTCNGMVQLLEKVKSDIDMYNVDFWKLENIKHNY